MCKKENAKQVLIVGKIRVKVMDKITKLSIVNPKKQAYITESRNLQELLIISF